MQHLGLPRSGLVFLAGYGIILVLLVCSVLEAYRLQQESSRGQIGAYQSYFQTDEAIVKLRRAAWLGAASARDYFLNPNSDRDSRFRTEIDQTRSVSLQSLATLEKYAAADTAKLGLRNKIEAYLATLDEFALIRHSQSLRAHDLVQHVLVPSRAEVSVVLGKIAQLRQESLHQQQDLVAGQRKTAARNLITLLLTSVFLGGLVAWFSLRFTTIRERERTRHFEELVCTKQELEQLSARLVEVQEQERATIARELHDEVGQTLTALRMEISTALDHGVNLIARERLEKARRIAEQSVQTVRDISLMLRPSLLDDLGLGPALQWQLEAFSERNGIPSKFEGEEVGCHLPDPVKTCLYRITQEALHNCEKYANASFVQVVLGQSDTALTLEVRDNGVGFPSGVACRGIGILGMRERVLQVGGEFHIETQPLQGTAIKVTIPITAALQSPAEIEVVV